MRGILVGLLAAGALLGQESAFERMKREAARVQTLASGEAAHDVHAAAVAPVHAALRDWIESELPERRGATADEFRTLEAALKQKLRDARLDESGATPSGPHGPGEAGAGFVSFEFKRLPELPDALFVIASVTVDCGADEAVYLYHFGADGRTRVIEDHPKIEWGIEGAQFELSDPDDRGRRLLLTHYASTQCASVWMATAYSVYRLDAQHAAGELLLADQVGFRLSPSRGAEFVLKPEELVIELVYFGMDPGTHLARTRIYRYSFAQGVQRLDPVALQPHDFVEEWLTRPWSEMQTRSAADTKELHERVHGDSAGGHYSGVVRCGARPGRWLIAMDLDAAQPTYFLVHDPGNYRYRMEAAGAARPAGCLGTGLKREAIDKPAWLSREQLKALH